MLSRPTLAPITLVKTCPQVTSCFKCRCCSGRSELTPSLPLLPTSFTRRCGPSCPPFAAALPYSPLAARLETPSPLGGRGVWLVLAPGWGGGGGAGGVVSAGRFMGVVVGVFQFSIQMIRCLREKISHEYVRFLVNCTHTIFEDKAVSCVIRDKVGWGK